MPATRSAVSGALDEYDAERDFRAIPEPAPTRTRSHEDPIFVV